MAWSTSATRSGTSPDICAPDADERTFNLLEEAPGRQASQALPFARAPGWRPGPGVNDDGRRFSSIAAELPRKDLRPCQFEYHLLSVCESRSMSCSLVAVTWLGR